MKSLSEKVVELGEMNKKFLNKGISALEEGGKHIKKKGSVIKGSESQIALEGWSDWLKTYK